MSMQGAKRDERTRTETLPPAQNLCEGDRLALLDELVNRAGEIAKTVDEMLAEAEKSPNLFAIVRELKVLRSSTQYLHELAHLLKNICNEAQT